MFLPIYSWIMQAMKKFLGQKATVDHLTIRKHKIQLAAAHGEKWAKFNHLFFLYRICVYYQDRNKEVVSQEMFG